MILSGTITKCFKARYFIACVASVSVRFRSQEQGTSVKDRTKNGSEMPFTARITTGKVYVIERMFNSVEAW